MDRSWMKASRLSAEFERGVIEFIRFAEINLPSPENNDEKNLPPKSNEHFRCPCVLCGNKKLEIHKIKSIASEMEGKTEEEVERYAEVFRERYKELNDYDRIIKNIERGESRIARKDEIMKAIGKKLDRYKNPWLELKIQYGQNKGKLYNEECDRFMICMTHKLGYGNWDELKAAFRMSPLFRFDWFVKSRTTQELTRRCDTLIRLVEKENQEYDERERQARKEKKLATKSSTPSKRPLPRQAESPSLKKRKQLTMDHYVSSVSLLPMHHIFHHHDYIHVANLNC
ncbi:ISWI chromatin-remodeling complex ATPase CHR17-like [Trifolium pratense]|uniref:ISWI chromatin-remodeling complex ATPase CHR17-like n=1 Tax=Trifolium pratense TaxID=57577 RepID=UPI001E690042|nr:ISWI chromatin-remodeling complex ATPase CHR17-like [Trifolium pratense]